MEKQFQTCNIIIYSNEHKQKKESNSISNKFHLFSELKCNNKHNRFNANVKSNNNNKPKSTKKV